MIVYPGTIYTRAERLHVEFMNREGIWCVGLGSGVICIHSLQPLSEDLKSVLVNYCWPIGVHFVVTPEGTA